MSPRQLSIVHGEKLTASREEVDEAVRAARSAFAAWKAMPPARRQALLLTLAEAVEHRAEWLIQAGAREQEIGRCAVMFRDAVGLALEDEVIEESMRRRVIARCAPIGLVGFVMAREMSLEAIAAHLGSGLWAGNCMVILLSAWMPPRILRFVEVCRRALPPGVISVISSDAEVERWVAEHPGIDGLKSSDDFPMMSRPDTVTLAAVLQLKSKRDPDPSVWGLDLMAVLRTGARLGVQQGVMIYTKCEIVTLNREGLYAGDGAGSIGIARLRSASVVSSRFVEWTLLAEMALAQSYRCITKKTSCDVRKLT